MNKIWVCLPALGALAVGGCATNRSGVISNLPPPISNTRSMIYGRADSRPEAHTLFQRKPSWFRRGSMPGWRPSGGISDRWANIVVHHSGSHSGNAQSFDRYHRSVNGWDELGYHFVIGNGTASGDGQIEVGSRWLKQKHGAHCKTPDNHYNDRGIGICLVGDFRRHPPTRAQMESLTRLTRFLMSECNISLDNILTHRAVTGRTICPGTRFPLYALRRSLSGYSTASALP